MLQVLQVPLAMLVLVRWYCKLVCISVTNQFTGWVKASMRSKQDMQKIYEPLRRNKNTRNNFMETETSYMSYKKGVERNRFEGPLILFLITTDEIKNDTHMVINILEAFSSRARELNYHTLENLSSRFMVTLHSYIQKLCILKNFNWLSIGTFHFYSLVLGSIMNNYYCPPNKSNNEESFVFWWIFPD